jgi:hypothetical protein
MAGPENSDPFKDILTAGWAQGDEVSVLGLGRPERNTPFQPTEAP